MLSLESHHIVDLYVWVDDLVPKPVPNPHGGRPAVLRDSELITLLAWNALVLHQVTIKDLYDHARLHLKTDFPKLPKYNAFLEHCHRVVPVMFGVLQTLLCSDAPLKITDSTMLPVCKLHRADRTK